MIQFQITFEELPLIRESGMVAGLVGGEADIRAHESGEWFITAIRLDGALAAKADICLRPVADLDRGSWLFTAIHSELESGSFKSQIEDRVATELAEAGYGARSDFEEHNVLHAAGV